MTVIKRKMYKRGSSTETTIPKPLLFALDMEKKHDVLFKYDASSNRWYIEFEEATTKKETADKVGKRGKNISKKRRK